MLCVRHLMFVQVDNPLIDPFDAALLSQHVEANNQVTIKCIERRDPSESAGVLVVKDGKTVVVEYSELPQEEKQALMDDGTLLHKYANMSNFCFSIDFIAESAKREWPLHPAHKRMRKVDKLGEIDSHFMGWKFEKFIFDCLEHAERVSAVLYERRRCFAPLKNQDGEGNPDSVRRALHEYAHLRYRELTGESVPDGDFELDPNFYYRTLSTLPRES